jgi:2-oxoglutarate ferredoxin oxidoreductase subunit beta
MKTATTPYGRDAKLNGFPLVLAPMIAQLDGTAFITRQAVHTAAAARKAKNAIKKAFEYQMAGKGYCIIEVVSTCPTNWGMSPADALQWMRDNMIPYYPLGVYKDVGEGEQ